MCEPGLRVIRSGGPTPWGNLSDFVESVTDLSLRDLNRAANVPGPIFFDRGLFDALSGKAQRLKVPLSSLMPTDKFPYAEPVFYAPPWPEIFKNTPERKLSFEAGREEAIRLRSDLELLGIGTIELPCLPVVQRVKYVLENLGLA